MEKKIQDLEAEIELLNLILNNSFGNTYVTDNTGKIIYVNDNTVKTLGVSRQALLDMTTEDLLRQNIVSSAATYKTIETEKEVMQPVELREGGTLVVSARPIFDEDGKLKYVVVFSQNKVIVENFIQSMVTENKVIKQTLDRVLQNTEDGQELIAESKAIKKCMSIARNAAELDSTIMLYGESGSGKERIAQYIHGASPRRSKLFFAVNCAAIPESLIESEFFGYEKGAFTGSNKDGKIGMFEMADEGTLFLDEIGEITAPMQAKLLRVLETGEIRRVGGNVNKKVDVRIIAATNRDLRQMMGEGKFREDLYYRLNVIPITVPPLRNRKEDTVALSKYFLAILNKKYGNEKSFDKDALDALKDYSWPGNVRELRNVIERIFVVVSSRIITRFDVEDVLGRGAYKASTENRIPLSSENALNYGSLQDATKDFQRNYILSILKKYHGNIELSAADLGIAKSGLYKKINALGLRQKNLWE